MKKIIFLPLLLSLATGLWAQRPNLEGLSTLSLESVAGEEPVPYDFQKNTAGKIVWIEFWEHWCGPCIAAMPRLGELQKKFPQELKIVAVSAKDWAKARAFVTKNDYPFDFVFDRGQRLRKLFPHQAIPHSVLIDAKGNFVGVAHPEQITEAMIRDLLAGKPVELTTEEGDAVLNTVSAMVDQRRQETRSEEPVRLSLKLKETEMNEGGQSSSSFSTPGAEGETIRRIEWKGYTPTQLVAACYDIPLFRIVKPDVRTQEERLDLTFRCSDRWASDADAMLRTLIGPALGVDIRPLEKETEVWVWKGIQAGEAIKTWNLSRSNGVSQSAGKDFFRIDGVLSAGDLVSKLEDLTGIPILVEMPETAERYQLSLEIRHEGQGPDRIFELLNQAGIVLEKAKRPVEYWEITPKNNNK